MQDTPRIGTQELNQPSIGEKPLFICFGPCLGPDDGGNRETEYKRVLPVQALRTPSLPTGWVMLRV